MSTTILDSSTDIPKGFSGAVFIPWYVKRLSSRASELVFTSKEMYETWKEESKIITGDNSSSSIQMFSVSEWDNEGYLRRNKLWDSWEILEEWILHNDTCSLVAYLYELWISNYDYNKCNLTKQIHDMYVALKYENNDPKIIKLFEKILKSNITQKLNWTYHIPDIPDDFELLAFSIMPMLKQSFLRSWSFELLSIELLQQIEPELKELWRIDMLFKLNHSFTEQFHELQNNYEKLGWSIPDFFEMDFFDKDWDPDSSKLEKKLTELKTINFLENEKLLSLYILALLSFYEKVIEREKCAQDICDYWINQIFFILDYLSNIIWKVWNNLLKNQLEFAMKVVKKQRDLPRN